MSKIKLAIGLRVYEKTREALALKMRFLENIPWNVVSKVFVAVNVEKDKSGALEYFNVVLADPRIEAFPVQPWFKIGIPALDAIVHKATAEQFSHIWFVSTRLVLNQEITERLIRELDNKTLVVGTVMPGHWLPGANLVAGDGGTCPYNTCAIWNLGYLHRTGFLPISEMPTNLEMAGNEEIVVITLQQQLFTNKAKLVLVPGIKSQTDHWDDERKERHDYLVSSKKVRSETQLNMLSLNQAKIIHIC
mgnify:CR=1 FL=1